MQYLNLIDLQSSMLQTDDILPFKTSLVGEYALLLAKPPFGLGLTEDQVKRVGEMSLEARFK